MPNTDNMLWLMNIPGSIDRWSQMSENERYWRLHGVEGEPRATEAYTSDELRTMGYVGLYDPKRREDWKPRNVAEEKE